MFIHYINEFESINESTRHVEHATVVATGLQKKDALRSVAENKELVASIPAMILQKMKHVDLFTDISLN